MVKRLFWLIEDLVWNIRCRYNFWLHGPYGLSKVVEKMPYRFLTKYLRKYGASVGEKCRFERGLNIHRPIENPPFKNLSIGNNIYLGHNTLIDLTKKVKIEDNVIIASRCQIWTHASFYGSNDIDNLNYQEKLGEVVIKNASMIYSGVIIIQGITIGERSVIGAGSIIINDVPGFQFFAGNPAKFIKKLN
ncbi:MAG: acyltransferase [Bacteroidales bacterium]|jgi:acetyltransferase-like isoleucine patch superfamily enzyme